jgi:hypothetical protein
MYISYIIIIKEKKIRKKNNIEIKKFKQLENSNVVFTNK